MNMEILKVKIKKKMELRKDRSLRDKKKIQLKILYNILSL